MQTVLVVAQDLDDLAVRDRALGALRQHAFQFLLQGLKAHNAVLDRDKLARGDDISSSARHVGLVRKTEQFPDVVQRKAEFTGVADKGEPLLLLHAIEPLVARATLRLGQQTNLLVVADGGNFDAGTVLANPPHRLSAVIALRAWSL